MKSKSIFLSFQTNIIHFPISYIKGFMVYNRFFQKINKFKYIVRLTYNTQVSRLVIKAQAICDEKITVSGIWVS